VRQQPNSGLDHLIFEVYRSHTIRHKQPVDIFRTSDQLVIQAATCTAQNTRGEHPCCQQNSYPRFQQSSGCWLTAWTARSPGSAVYCVRGFAVFRRNRNRKTVKSGYSFVRMEQLGSQWRDFHEIWCLSFFRKSAETVQKSLKSDNNDWYFT